MRALPVWLKGFVYSFLCIFTLAQTGFGQGPAAASAYGKLPLSFEPNQGQTAGEVQFLSRGRGYTLFLSSSDSVLALHRGHRGTRADRMETGPSADAPAALRMHLVGANASAQGVAEDALPGKSNYFIGNDRAKWRTDVPNYGRVRYRGVYPGIDLVYYGNQRLLEHDFVVAPGADPRRIRLAFEGIKRAAVEKSGDLVLQLADGEVRLQKPVIYQNTEEGRREVTGGYVLRKNQVTIQVGDYARSKTLVIDPVLAYSTYLGGSSYDYAYGIAVDSGGNAYVTGYTASTDFPGTAASFNGTPFCTGCSHVFVTKLNPTGTAAVYSTYFGGSGYDYGYAIAVDASGNAYVTGPTSSTNFPLAGGAVQSTLNGTYNAFVTVLNPTGTGLVYSTFLGGSASDFSESIAIDSGASPNIYVTGASYSSDFPLVGTPISTPPPVVYHSNNAGSSWSGAIDFKSLYPTALAVDGGTPGTLYAAGYGIGVNKSTDGGATWAPTALTRTYIYAHQLVIDPTTTGTSATLYAGSSGSVVYRLTSGGSTLAPLNVGACCSSVLALNPNNSAQLYVGTQSQGVYVSNNANGASPTFTQLTTTGLIISPSTIPAQINALVVDKNTGALYAGTTRGVFQLLAGATSWNAFSTGLPSSTYIYDLAEDASSTLYASNYSALYKTSTAGAAAWASISGSGSSALPAGSTRVAVDPLVAGTIYAGGANGLFKTTNGGATWAPSNSGLQPKQVTAIAVDPANSVNVYAGMENIMAFVAKFSAAGSAIYSSQYGGLGDTYAYDAAADSAGNFYVGGYTDATGIPGPLVGQTTPPSTSTGFLVKINSSGGVAYDRYLGGTSFDYVQGVAVDGSGNVYLTGESDSTNFPVTAGAYQSTNRGGVDVFLTKIDPSGANLLYSTFLGGTNYEYGNSIALVNANGRVAIAGTTQSTDFPTVNATQPFSKGSPDGFYAQFDTTLSGAASLLYSTYLGGSSYDYPNALAIDTAGSAYIAGYTGSTDFPVTAGALQTTLAGTTIKTDAFVTKIQSTGQSSDVAVTMGASTGTAAAGVPFTYTITVTNNNTSPPNAKNVRLYDMLPSNITSASSSWTASPGVFATCNNSNPNFFCSIGDTSNTLPPGSSATITLTVTAGVPTTNPFPNTARVSTDDDDPNPANNSATTSVTVQLQADLMVTNATAAQQASGYSPTTLADGTAATDWFNVTNNGPSNATGVIVTIPVPTGVTFNGSGNGTPCTLSGSTVTCSVGTIAAGATSAVLFRWTPIAIGTVINAATVSSSQVIDANSSNNSASWTTTVSLGADLSVTGSGPAASVTGSSTVTFTTTVKNSGPDSSNTTVVETLPPGFTFVSAIWTNPTTGSNGACTFSAGVITCPVGNLPYTGTPTTATITTLATAGTQLGIFSLGAIASSTNSVDTIPLNNAGNAAVLVALSTNARDVLVMVDNELNTVRLFDANLTDIITPPPVFTAAPRYGTEVLSNGRIAFFGRPSGGYISVYDLAIQAEINRIPLTPSNDGALSPDGSTFVVATGDVVNFVNTATFQVMPVNLNGLVGDNPSTTDISLGVPVVVGTRAYFSPSGLLNGSPTSGIPVVVVDLVSHAVTTIAMPTTSRGVVAGSSRHTIAATRDGRYLIALRADGNVIVDLTNNSVVARETTLTNSVRIVATNRDFGNPNVFAYVLNNQTIAAIDLRTGSPTFGTVMASASGAIGGNNFIENSFLSIRGDGLSLISTDFGQSFTNIDIRLLLSNASTVGTGAVIPTVDFNTNSMQAIDLTVPSGAPTVTGVSPTSMRSDTPTTVAITGTNFAAGALVGSGRGVPLAATFISSTQLQVTVPAGVTTGKNLDVVVTNPNTGGPIGQQNLSGVLRGAFTILPPASFTSTDKIVSATQSGSIDVANPSPQSFPIPQNPLRPVGTGTIAVTSDGGFAFDPMIDNTIDVVNLSTGAHTFKPIATRIAYIVRSIDPSTLAPVMYVANTHDASPFDLQVIKLDANPSSPTFGSVLATIPGGLNAFAISNGIAVTPNGRYVYVEASGTGLTPSAQVIIFDTLTQTRVGNLGLSTVGAATTQVGMIVTPDGKYLILLMATTSNIGVFSLANPASPVLQRTITATVPTGYSSIALSNYLVARDRLYANGTVTTAAGATQPVLDIFTFDPVANNFALLSNFLGGTQGIAAGPMTISSDGTKLYVAATDNDAVQVIDINKVIFGDPTAVVVNLGAPFGPIRIATPYDPPTASYDLSLSMTHTPEPAARAGQVTILLTAINSGSDVTNAVISETLPAGTTFVPTNPFCTIVSTTISCSLGTLAAGQSATVSFTLRVPSTTGSFTSTATITSTETAALGDVTPANNTASNTVNIANGADVSVAVSASQSSIATGGSVTFATSVANNGLDPSGAIVTETLPAGFTLVSATFNNPSGGTNGNCSSAGSLITCNIGSLPYSGTPTTATITVSATAGSTLGLFSLGATAAATTPDVNPLNNSASAYVAVGTTANALDAYIIDDNAQAALLFLNPGNLSQFNSIPQFMAQPRMRPVVSPNGRLLFTGFNYISVVDLSIKAEINRIPVVVSAPYTLTADGKTLVVPARDTVVLVDTATFQTTTINVNGLATDDPANTNDITLGAAVLANNKAYFNPSGLRQGSTSVGLPIVVVDLTTHAVTTIPVPTTGRGTTVSFELASAAATPDGHYLVALRRDGMLIVDLTTNIVVLRNAPIASIAFNLTVAMVRTAGDPNVFAYLASTFPACVYQVDLRTGSPTFGQVIAFVNATTNVDINGSAIPEVYHPGLSADGRYFYTDDFLKTITRVDTALMQTSPSIAATNTILTGIDLNSSSLAIVDFSTVSGAPTVTSVTPNAITTNGATVTVQGANFASGATVRFGLMSPMPATVLSSTQLQVTLPAGVLAQSAMDVIVTNPNTAGPIGQQNLSGILRGAFTVELAATVRLATPLVSSMNSNGVTSINRRSQFTAIPQNPLHEVQGAGVVTADGGYMFTPVSGDQVSPTTFVGGGVAITNLSTGATSIRVMPVSTTVGNNIVLRSVHPITAAPIMYLAAPNDTQSDLVVKMIDANPASGTFGSVLASVNAGAPANTFPVTRGLAATPNGRYVFAGYFNYPSLSNYRIVVFDMQSSTVAGLLNPITFGAAVTQSLLAITADGYLLMLMSNTGNIGVFNVSNPLSPSLVGTIQGVLPSGATFLTTNAFVVSGNTVYVSGLAFNALSVSTPTLQMFHYNPATPDLSLIASYTAAPLSTSGPLSVSSDNTQLYLTATGADQVQIFDIAKLTSNDPTALVATFGTPFGPTMFVSNNGATVPSTDLQLAMTATPNPAIIGGTVTYNFTISNNGPLTATNVVLEDPLPAGTVPVSQPSISCTGATCSCSNASPVVCSVSSIASGSTASGSIVASVPGSTGVFTNTARVVADQAATTSSNVFSVNDNAVLGSDLAVTMTASPSPVAVLGSVTYQITLTNNGPSPATGVVLTDTLPVGTLFASIDDLTDCAVSNGVLACNFASLAAGSSTTVNLILVPLVVPSGAGTFTNTTTVTANQPDPALSNNSATQTVQVTGANLSGGGALRNLPGFSHTITPPNDDDSFGPVPLGFNVNFFGLQVSSLFVNNNGNVTFDSALGEFTPFPLNTPGAQIIAPYFSDVGTYQIGSGLVTYGNDTVNGRPAFGVNWPNVDYYGELTPTLVDLFQLVLVDRSDVNPGDFDIEFNYDKMQWETGDASSGVNGLGGSSARVGYSNGTGATFELPGSGVPGSFLDSNTATGLIYNTLNSTPPQPGRYLFQVRNGVVQSSDLAVSMSPSATQVAPGSNLTYTITVTNNGPSASTGYTLTDTLPSNATFVSATSGCVLSTALTCTGSGLPSGQSANYVVVVTPTALGTVSNTASVSGTEPDLVPANNSATVTVTVVAPAAADLAVAAAAAPSPGGGFPAYAATVTNNGPAGATNVVLTDLLDNYGFVSASSTQGSCTFSAPTVTCSLGTLVNGASAVVTVVVTAPNAGWAANTYHASAAQPDPNPINNAVRLGPSLDSFNTPVGSNVAINTSDPADNLVASLTFSNVTRIGSTTMTSMSAASLPAGFRSGRQPTVFDISTNAEFAGAIGLNIHFLPANFRHPALVRLFHFEGGTWVDRTMGLNVSLGVIAGQVMSLSPFALLEPLDTIPVANAGADHSVPGAMAAGARVTLDGSASVDADGDPLTYRWSGPFPEGGGTLTGINPTVTLPLGVSKVSLVVNDGEADSPAVALNLAVADFQVSAPAGSVALTRGQSTSFTITMTPQYGAFGAPINLSCAPGAADVTCSFSAASVTPGATPSTATLTVTAAPTVARAPGRSMPAYFALWFGTLPVFGVVFLAAGRRKKWQMAVLLMLLLVLVASHIGCGGGGTTQTQSSSSSPPPGTKAVTIAVTGTSGTLQHSSSVTVTIPQ